MFKKSTTVIHALKLQIRWTLPVFRFKFGLSAVLLQNILIFGPSFMSKKFQNFLALYNPAAYYLHNFIMENNISYFSADTIYDL